MDQIEFIGAPGAGKSTLFSELIKSDKFYGGVEDGGTGRLFNRKANRKQQILSKITPPPVRTFILEEFIQYRLGHTALEEFIRNHPDFINTVSKAMDSVSYQPEQIFSFFKRSAERYQIGISTAYDCEVLCLDESFVQRALAILFRYPKDSFSLPDYFNNIPIPDLVVHVDAPTETCISRQRNRGDVVADKQWESGSPRQVQERLRSICSGVRKNLPDDTRVIMIENTKSLDSVVNMLRQEINQLG